MTPGLKGLTEFSLFSCSFLHYYKVTPFATRFGHAKCRTNQTMKAIFSKNRRLSVTSIDLFSADLLAFVTGVENSASPLTRLGINRRTSRKRNKQSEMTGNRKRFERAWNTQAKTGKVTSGRLHKENAHKSK